MILDTNSSCSGHGFIRNENNPNDLPIIVFVLASSLNELCLITLALSPCFLKVGGQKNRQSSYQLPCTTVKCYAHSGQSTRFLSFYRAEYNNQT